MTVRRMLAVTHETTLTGAPMNLLHFLGWIKDNTSIEVDLLALQDGPLRHRFDQVCDVTVLDRSRLLRMLGVVQQGLLHLGSSRAWKPVARARLHPQLRRFDGYDLVYSNSIASGAVLPYLPPGRCGGESRARAAGGTAHLATSGVPRRDRRSVRRLDRRLGRGPGPPRRGAWVRRRPGPAAPRVHRRSNDRRVASSRRGELERHRRELGIPADAAVVVGAGTLDWRKGADLFVQLAAEVRRQTREPVSFVWVGGDLSSANWERVRSDIERTGSDHVHFVGIKPDPIPWFAMADVFAFTSREDPFPLVCLEHAALGIPIVTYRNGGMPELLEAAGPDAAIGIVDHLDVGSIARAGPRPHQLGPAQRASRRPACGAASSSTTTWRRGTPTAGRPRTGLRTARRGSA